jgi:hypothetical protein
MFRSAYLFPEKVYRDAFMVFGALCPGPFFGVPFICLNKLVSENKTKLNCKKDLVMSTRF